MTTQHAKSNAREGDGVADAVVDRALQAFHGAGGNSHHVQWTADQRRSMRAALEAAMQAQQGAEPVAGYYLASFKHGSADGCVMWWMPNNAGYSSDLEQAGIYHDLLPGYHDSENTVPVPASFIQQLRVRRVVDYGDSLNTAFHNAKSLRAILAATGAPR